MKKPRINKTKLSNGLTVLHLMTENDPISACHLFLPGGTMTESATQGGLGALRWSLLLKGTIHRSARQLAEDIESLGAALSAGTTHDYSEVSCHSIAEYFPAALKIMAEAVLHPSFPEAEIEKEKSVLMAAIKSKKENIFSVASETLNAHLFSKHPYGRPISGTEDSVASFNLSHLKSWQKNHVTPRSAILAVASSLSTKKLHEQIQTFFGPRVWRKSKPSKSFTGSIKIPKKNIYLEQQEKFEQAYLLIGFPAAGVGSEQYIPIKLLNSLLGGGMSARLFQELREKRGLAYDVGSYYASKVKKSAFVVYMGLQFSQIEKAKKTILEVLHDIQNQPVSKEELNQVKNYLKGTYILDHQTNSQRAHYIGWWHVLDKGFSFDQTYIKKIDKVTPTQLQKTARELFRQKGVTVEIHPKKETEKVA